MKLTKIESAELWNGDMEDVFKRIETKVDLVLTDPPYSSGGAHRSDRNKSTQEKYHDNPIHQGFSGDNRDQRSLERWCAEWMRQCLKITRVGGVLATFIDWRNLASVIDALQIAGWVYRGIVPWDKINGRPQKGWFRSTVEYVVIGSAGPMMIGSRAEGLCADGIIRCQINPSEKLHQTGKPVALMEHLISIREGFDVVFDPFMGSGTTAVAALHQGKRFIGVERDEHYYDIACKRIKDERAQLRLEI